MGININDLDNNAPIGASLLSGNESILDNLRELSPEELKIAGGGKGKGKGEVIIYQPSYPPQPYPSQPYPTTYNFYVTSSSTSNSNSRSNSY